MMEDAVHFLSKETVVQAITRSATKVSYFLGKGLFYFFSFQMEIQSIICLMFYLLFIAAYLYFCMRLHC